MPPLPEFRSLLRPLFFGLVWFTIMVLDYRKTGLSFAAFAVLFEGGSMLRKSNVQFNASQKINNLDSELKNLLLDTDNVNKVAKELLKIKGRERAKILDNIKQNDSTLAKELRSAVRELQHAMAQATTHAPELGEGKEPRQLTAGKNL